ncbi:MAG: HEPN domain-containing protein [Bacteroidota bacterium]
MNEVERVFEELKSIREHFKLSNAGLSLYSSLSEFDAKVMLLCSASYFERIVCDRICKFFRDYSSRDTMHFFVLNQAINRKYHTLFDWNARNTNKFFKLFGRGFHDHMKEIIRENSEYERGMKDFIDLGSRRNQLVHENYATFNLDYTAEEIFEKFVSADKFIDMVFYELCILETNSDIDAS